MRVNPCSYTKTYSQGRSTALVVDVGASGVSCVPVYDGLVLAKNIKRNVLGGDYLTAQFEAVCTFYFMDIFVSWTYIFFSVPFENIFSSYSLFILISLFSEMLKNSSMESVVPQYLIKKKYPVMENQPAKFDQNASPIGVTASYHCHMVQVLSCYFGTVLLLLHCVSQKLHRVTLCFTVPFLFLLVTPFFTYTPCGITQ